jgi:antitoxin CptB
MIAYLVPTGIASARRTMLHGEIMDQAARLRRLRYRAWHRGTQEADLLIGGYFDCYGAEWAEDQLAWFETLLEEQDVDIMAWAIGTQPVPERFEGEMMNQLKTLDYISHPQ